MNFDVYADLDHLFMLNFSMDAGELSKLLPEPLRVLEKDGAGFPSIVMPSIKRLRPTFTRFPQVDYELFGLRILVEYDSAQLGTTKGIYFAKLIMDPNWVRHIANKVTPFVFDKGTITKWRDGDKAAIQVSDRQGDLVVNASVKSTEDFPSKLTDGSVFSSADEALAMYNDIAYGFLPLEGAGRVELLQIAEPHPNYVAWPLTHLEVEDIRVSLLHDNELFGDAEITLEPSYYVGFLPRYWRWLKPEFP